MIQTLLFMSGVNTLLQSWFGSRLPVVMGGSLAFVLPVMSIINDYNDQSFSSEHQVCFSQTVNRLWFQLLMYLFILNSTLLDASSYLSFKIVQYVSFFLFKVRMFVESYLRFCCFFVWLFVEWIASSNMELVIRIANRLWHLHL